MSERTFKCCECCAAGVDADTHAREGKDWHEADCDACNGHRFSREEYLALIAEVERAAAEKALTEAAREWREYTHIAPTSAPCAELWLNRRAAALGLTAGQEGAEA